MRQSWRNNSTKGKEEKNRGETKEHQQDYLEISHTLSTGPYLDLMTQYMTTDIIKLLPSSIYFINWSY